MPAIHFISMYVVEQSVLHIKGSGVRVVHIFLYSLCDETSMVITNVVLKQSYTHTCIYK